MNIHSIKRPKKVLLVPDPHAHPDFNNDRADWLGQYIKDERPDVVVNIGDTFDMPSLSSFDKGKASFSGANYEKDINSGLDFLDRMWHPMRKTKKKKPYSVFCVGNHEQRLNRVLEQQPELGGERYGIGWSNYGLDKYHDEVVPYVGITPSIWTLDSVDFAHFFVSGVMAKAIGGINHANTMLSKNHRSSVCGHSHMADFAVQTASQGSKIMSVVGGIFQDYNSVWAGNTCKLWWRGLVMLNNLEGSTFDPEFVNLKSLERAYGKT
jgi:hypothetical protein